MKLGSGFQVSRWCLPWGSGGRGVGAATAPLILAGLGDQTSDRNSLQQIETPRHWGGRGTCHFESPHHHKCLPPSSLPPRTSPRPVCYVFHHLHHLTDTVDTLRNHQTRQPTVAMDRIKEVSRVPLKLHPCSTPPNHRAPLTERTADDNSPMPPRRPSADRGRGYPANVFWCHALSGPLLTMNCTHPENEPAPSGG